MDAAAHGSIAGFAPRPSTPPAPPMRRLCHTPHLALATLWADMLSAGGIATVVQRPFASGIAGEIPPDQAGPELWVLDDAQLAQARTLLAELQHPPSHRWACRGCAEIVDGPFEQCWNCGTPRPAA